MKARARRIALAMALGVLMSCENPNGHAPSTSRSGGGFLALGDSYTIGEAVDPSDRWPNQLVRLLRERAGRDFGEVRIIATTGWTTDELSAAIDRERPQPPFDRVSLLIGVNNQYRGRSVESFRPEFTTLLHCAIALAGGEPSRVFVVSIPDWGVMPFASGRDRAAIAREIDAYNAACRDISTAAGVRFIDITPISRRAAEDPSLVASDGLHPSGAQYRLWTQAIAAALQESGN